MEVFDAPEYYICDEQIPPTDLIFEFFYYRKEVELGALTWITHDPLTNKISAGNEVKNYLDFK